MPREAKVSHSIALPDGMAASIEGNTVTLSKEKQPLQGIHTQQGLSKPGRRRPGGFLQPPKEIGEGDSRDMGRSSEEHGEGARRGLRIQAKGVFSHFPMTLKVDGNKFTITNMLGEKVPRVAKLPWTPSEVQVKIEGKSDIIVTGADREKVGQSAANIERACKVKKRDPRVFQDGIYITSKGA